MNRTVGAFGALVLATAAYSVDQRHTESAPEGDIQVWAMGTEGESLDVLADAFMEEFPDVSVEVTAVPWTRPTISSSPP